MQNYDNKVIIKKHGRQHAQPRNGQCIADNVQRCCLHFFMLQMLGIALQQNGTRPACLSHTGMQAYTPSAAHYAASQNRMHRGERANA
jgi:hypothetical protein